MPCPSLSLRTCSRTSARRSARSSGSMDPGASGFKVKKWVGDAGTFFSRAVQYTEEKLGTSEKTELDAHFENLAQRADTTKKWTEKILSDTQSVLIPNPGNRLEDYVVEKIERRRPNRLSNLEWLGMDMISAGNDYGPGTAFGSALIKVGACQQKMGQSEREYITSTAQSFMQPLQKFLDGDMKTIMKERKLLENKRLDLDACKNKLRKAKSLEAQHNLKEGVDPKQVIAEAERDLRQAQAEFDKQTEITKLLLEGISSSHANQLRNLADFVDSQLRFYAQCHEHLSQLQRDLSRLGPGDSSPVDNPGSSRLQKYKAKVLYDYESRAPDELSVLADEVVTIYKEPGVESDHVLAEAGGKRGRIPSTYLEVLQ